MKVGLEMEVSMELMMVMMSMVTIISKKREKKRGK